MLLAQSTGQQQSENAVIFHREKFFPIISSDGEAEGDTRTVMSEEKILALTSRDPWVSQKNQKREKKESFASWKRLAFLDLRFPLSISI